MTSPRFCPAAQVRAPLVHPAARACPSSLPPRPSACPTSPCPAVCVLPFMCVLRRSRRFHVFSRFMSCLLPFTSPRFLPAAQVRAPLVHPTPVRALPNTAPPCACPAHPPIHPCVPWRRPAQCPAVHPSTHPPVCALPHPAPPCAFCLSCVFLGEAGVFTSFRVSRLASYLLPLPASAPPPKCVPRSSTQPPVRSLSFLRSE